MYSKTKVNQLMQRLNKLDKDNIKITLDFIRDKQSGDIAFRISAIDRKGAVIEQEIFTDIPRDYLNKYQNKYNSSCIGGKVYDVIDNQLIESVL